MRRFLCARLLAALIVTGAAGPAGAHRAATGAAVPRDAVLIPNLTHGQMRVIAAYRSDVMDLAADQAPTDPTMRRLETFINLQRFACLWGLMPGSVADEDSPFNECAHAYLAATRALLLHLQTMPGQDARKRTLVRDVELAMLSNDASLMLCRFSDEPFDTADIVAPHWSALPFHPASSLAVGGSAAAVMVLVAALRRRVPRAAPD